jgi:hypothetical protein
MVRETGEEERKRREPILQSPDLKKDRLPMVSWTGDWENPKGF